MMDAVSYVPDAITFMPASFNVTVAQPSGSSNVMVSHPLSTVHSMELSCPVSRGFGFVGLITIFLIESLPEFVAANTVGDAKNQSINRNAINFFMSFYLKCLSQI